MAALLVDAARVECGVQMDVSTPESPRTALTQHPIASLVTCLGICLGRTAWYCGHLPIAFLWCDWNADSCSENVTVVTPCLQKHSRISLIQSRGCRMLLPSLLFDVLGNIKSLLFSIPFIGFQYHVGFSTKSHLCVIAPFLKVVPCISQNYCINIHPLISFTHLLTASLFVCQPHRKTFRERSFSFTGPTVWDNLPFAIHSINSILSFRQVLKTHLFKSYFVSN